MEDCNLVAMLVLAHAKEQEQQRNVLNAQTVMLVKSMKEKNHNLN